MFNTLILKKAEIKKSEVFESFKKLSDKSTNNEQIELLKEIISQKREIELLRLLLDKK